MGPCFCICCGDQTLAAGPSFGGAHSTRRMFFKQKLCFLSTGFNYDSQKRGATWGERRRDRQRVRKGGGEGGFLRVSLPVSHTPSRSIVSLTGVMALDVRFTSRFAVRYYDPRQFPFPSKRLRECTESIMLSACAHLKYSVHCTKK